MSAGKIAAQVSHASAAYFANLINSNIRKVYTDRFLTKDENDKPIEYKNKSLAKIAKKALEDGKKYISATFTEEGKYVECEDNYKYLTEFELDRDVYEQWLNDRFTKTVCGARNKEKLLKAVEKAKELGLEEGKDFFIIKDVCLTELTPEDKDENGEGYTITCIGFKPLPDDVAHAISMQYHLL